MFGFSKKDKKLLCPIPDERRQWLEHAFDWLVGAFGEDSIRRRKVLIPHHSDFPIRYDGRHASALDTVGIIARQMEIDPSEIELFFFRMASAKLPQGIELSHIKLLGEERLLENDEQLTDINTVVFGLGIFNANAAFSTFQNFRSSGWRKLGYLTQMDWGYVLALFARLRGDNDPEWAKHLCKNVQSDFTKSSRYLGSAM